MNTNCQVRITRGKNKGKLCGQIHKYCHNLSHKQDSSKVEAKIETKLEIKINKQSHIQNQIQNFSPIEEEYICKYCHKSFTVKTNMYRHQKYRCPKNNQNDNDNESFDDMDMQESLIYQHPGSESKDPGSESKDPGSESTKDPGSESKDPGSESKDPVTSIDELTDYYNKGDRNNYHHDKSELLEIIKKQQENLGKLEVSITNDSSIQINQATVNNITNNNVTTNNNNYIQIVCIGQNDDFYQILSDRMGPEKAKEYILNCAKNNLEGDLNLLKTIYFEGKNPAEYPIRFIDKKRNKVEFIDENKEKILDPSGVELTKRLCSSLQNGYLLQVNKILEDNLNQKNDGKFLDDFDIYNCQNHIYELSHKKYRKKLLESLPERLELNLNNNTLNDSHVIQNYPNQVQDLWDPINRISNSIWFPPTKSNTKNFFYN